MTGSAVRLALLLRYGLSRMSQRATSIPKNLNAAFRMMWEVLGRGLLERKVDIPPMEKVDDKKIDKILEKFKENIDLTDDEHDYLEHCEHLMKQQEEVIALSKEQNNTFKKINEARKLIMEWAQAKIRESNITDKESLQTALYFLLHSGLSLGKMMNSSVMDELERANRDFELQKVKNSLVEGGSKGGKTSGKNRRQKRTENWESDALEIANRVRSKDKSRPQKELASDIQNLWTREDSEPGFEWLLRLIRAAERDGRLPRRNGRTASVNGGSKGVR